MPIIRPGSSGTAGWTGAANSGAAYLANRPAILAAARARASQMVLNQQRGQQYQAQAALLAQKLSDMKISADDREKLRGAAEEAAPFIQSGQMDRPEVKVYSGMIAKIAAENKDHPAVQMLNALGMPQPNAAYAADKRTEASKYGADKRTESAKTVADIRATAASTVADKTVAGRLAVAGMNPYTTVTSGGAVVDKRTGAIVAQNPSAAANRAVGYDTVTEDVDADTGKPAVPPTPAIPARSGFFGIGARDAVPASPGSPAVPPHGKMKVVRKVPRGEPYLSAPVQGEAVNGDDGAETANPSIAARLASTGVNVRPAAAVAPTEPDTGEAEAAPVQAAPAATTAPVKVRVVHPNGTTGSIPATQVDAALKQGFKLAGDSQPQPQ